MPYVLFLLICAIWGGNFILMKKALLAYSPVHVALWRVVSGAAVLGLLWWWQGGKSAIRPRDVFALAFVGLVGYAWPYAIQPYLVKLHGSAFVGMTVSFVPLLTVLASIPLMGVYPTRRQFVGVIGGLICMGALMADGLKRQVPPVDLLLAGSVPLSYAVTNICIRVRLRHVSPLVLTLASLALTAGALAPLTLALESESVQWHGQLVLATAAIAMLGIIGTGVATYWFNILVKDHGPLFAGMVTYLVPAGALIWGWLDHERVTLLQLSALCGIFLMVAIAQYRAATPKDRA